MLKMYNTPSRRLEEFKPLDLQRVTFYHCGPTVYWTQHIGNMRGMTMADLIRRTLIFLGYQVAFVRNYTDVGHLTGDNEGDADRGEDRMEKAVRREKRSAEEIAQTYIAQFENDIEALNLIPADIKARATRHIPEIIAMVQKLLEKGYAYETELAVYLDVTKVKDYTKLSGQNIEENIAGAGKGDVHDSQKRNTADFSLWFFKAGAHRGAVQTWKSPFHSSLVADGEGFPGWHIECSAMAKKYLGDTLDIHMGGVEHIPIHHTNEIAQSELANDKPFVRYWLHNEHLLVDGRKMAKSEGTGYALDEVRGKGFDPLALRYFFLNAHYRSKQNFTWDALKGAQNALEKLYDHIRAYPEAANQGVKEFEYRFRVALEDDFNMPQGLAVVWDLVKSDYPGHAKKASLLKFDQVLGLKLAEVGDEKIEIPPGVQILVEEREKARKAKDFKKSDELREEIAKLGFQVEDTFGGARVGKKRWF